MKSTKNKKGFAREFKILEVFVTNILFIGIALVAKVPKLWPIKLEK
jgi:hypothetical protein